MSERPTRPAPPRSRHHDSPPAARAPRYRPHDVVSGPADARRRILGRVDLSEVEGLKALVERPDAVVVVSVVEIVVEPFVRTLVVVRASVVTVGRTVVVVVGTPVVLALGIAIVEVPFVYAAIAVPAAAAPTAPLRVVTFKELGFI